MIFIPPQVVTSALLFNPIIAQLFGVILGVDVIPGWLSFLGAGIGLVGVYLVNKGENARQLKIQIR